MNSGGEPEGFAIDCHATPQVLRGEALNSTHVEMHRVSRLFAGIANVILRDQIMAPDGKLKLFELSIRLRHLKHKRGIGIIVTQNFFATS
jgi:hypothetical protein